MTVFKIDKSFSRQGRITQKVGSVLNMFGLDLDRLAESAPHHKCQLEIHPGQIIFLTGPSGSGKSVLLRELFIAMGGPSPEGHHVTAHGKALGPD